MSPLNNQTVFDNLCKSSLQFLEKSVGSIETEPKFALLHFCTSVELFLKARLVKEHWSLVVAQKPDRRTFLDGSFKSVNSFEAMNRLDKICGEAISAKSKSAFEELIKHRNSVMHFYHTDENEDIEAFRIKVAKDICVGAYFLEKNLNRWLEIYIDHSDGFKAAFWRVRRVRTFLEVSFKESLAELKLLQKQGANICKCDSCGFVSAIKISLTKALSEKSCLVCKVENASIDMVCPDCGLNNTYSGYDGFQLKNCASCKELITKEDFESFLDTSYIDGFRQAKNCAMCSTMGDVVTHNDYHICMECLEFDDKISFCDWCNEAQLGGGDLEYSYHKGCEFCDGHSGWR